MKKAIPAAAMLFMMSSSLMAATAPLFSGAGESKWSVVSGGAPVGNVTLLTDGTNVRAEWKAKSGGSAVVFIGAKQKIWVRATGGDIALAGHKGAVEKMIVPALLLPFTTSPKDKVELAAGKPKSYTYGSTKAAYTTDAKGPASIEVTGGGKTYTLKRTSLLGKLTVSDPQMFVVQEKKSKLGGMKQLAGDLSGGSDSSASASAGTRGAGEEGVKLDSAGDYDALAKIEERDKANKGSLAKELAQFQKKGKVGKARGN